MDGIPKSGEFYRHFKNKLYQVVTVAVHSETGEKMVVYQALYGDYGVYVRPLSMFMERLNREKYPEASQEYRFEKVIPSDGPLKEIQEAGAEELEESQEEAMNPLLLEFLEEDGLEKKIGLLQAMKGKIGPRELDSLYVCLDAKPCGGTTEEQLDGLKQYLSMQQKYDASRLRRS